MTTRSETPVNRSAGKLVIAWLIVAIPALWGVSQTVIKSLALFQSHTPAATQSAATTNAVANELPQSTTSPTTAP